MVDWRALRERYWRRDAWPPWVVVLIGVALYGGRLVEILGDIDFLVDNWDRVASAGSYFTWIDDIALHPVFPAVLIVGGFVALFAIGRRPLPHPMRSSLDGDDDEGPAGWPPVDFAGVRWFYQGRYLIGGDMPWIEPYCLIHDVMLMLEKKSTYGVETTLEDVHKRAGRVATEDRDDLPTKLFCSRGHAVLLNAESPSLERVWLQAERLMDAELRKLQRSGTQ